MGGPKEKTNSNSQKLYSQTSTKYQRRMGGNEKNIKQKLYSQTNKLPETNKQAQSTRGEWEGTKRKDKLKLMKTV